MLVMVSNDTGFELGILVGQYPGRLGHLYSPGAQRGPWPEVPYALDNGAFPLAQKNLDWREAPWLDLLAWCSTKPQRPLWAVVPDKPYHRDETLAMWPAYAPVVRAAGIRPAFAVQDGMTFDDVPDAECVIFLGGSTGWKEDAIGPWCRRFPGRVHVARVTEAKRLMKCYEAGAVSIDGNGWWRKTNKPGVPVQRDALIRFLQLQQERRAA